VYVQRAATGGPCDHSSESAWDARRFNFDWDAKEDTFEPRLHEGGILFGRGVVAGVDRRAQRENAAHSEQMLLSRMRQARGELTTEADVQRDVARAARASHVDDDNVRSPALA
jgi:ATP-dependent RNA helicase DDX23/PRP28